MDTSTSLTHLFTEVMVLAPENGGRSSTVTSAVRFTLTMLLVGGGFSLLLSFVFF